MKYSNEEGISHFINEFLLNKSQLQHKHKLEFHKFLKKHTNLKHEEKIKIAKSTFSLEENEILDLL